MSKAKAQAYQSQQYPSHQPPYPYPYPYSPSSSSSSSGFATGFLLGQLTLAFILFIFIKFFIFGDAPSPDELHLQRSAARRQRTLSHANTLQQATTTSTTIATPARQRTLSSALRPRPSSAVLKPRSEGGPTVQKLLEKTYYNVHGHQPESLDWFNVLVAQTVAQLRADAQEDAAVLTSLTALLNGPSKPDFLDEIRVTEISLGDEFPIFSNCRVIPVDEHGTPIKALSGNRGERLQARMDVDLSDVVTLGIETKLVLNYPKPFVAVLPVALAVSVVRFSGTLSLSFSPSSQPNPYPSANDSEARTPGPARNEGHPLNPTGSSPTTLTFTFLDDYRLDLSVHSLIGSRSRLQDVPKIAQLVEARIHQWFDDRCVEPRFQQIVLPSLWPRKKNTRGGRGGGDAGDGGPEDGEDEGDRDEAPSPTERAMSSVAAAAAAAAVGGNGGASSKEAGGGGGVGGRKATAEVGKAKGFDDQIPSQSNQQQKQQPSAEEISSRTPAETKTSEQRTREWAARHATPTTSTTPFSGSKTTAAAAGGGGSGVASRRQQQQQQQLLNETAIAEEGEEEMMSELELAGEEMREADLRKKRLRKKRAEKVWAEQQQERQQQQQLDKDQADSHPRRYQRAGSLDGDLDDDDDVEGDKGTQQQQQQQRGEGNGKSSAHENGGVDYETGDFLGTGMRLRSGTGRSNSYIFEEGLVRGGGSAGGGSGSGVGGKRGGRGS
ncbi:hypothetical protein KC340_g18262 [Hortaea werneckii]|nr:hypothetical protein KC342_g18450 [Hortaea werneckii]KAI7057931.1 hypothetical protein KC339_g17789 [Hortaea werneckii]KAI7207573.1 hypothetical protein KC365_g16488 [Hortaea werneckii]KAI7286015.1 hypothetical protein KC340_g18262 [Hortaea werneckii]